ncbi:DUF1906 domain-containing protein [Saccharibacillus sp. CPCC 101409]|uniref:glycoside hydrolase domain-containing protein n=1 Tax=Saccharibacillus sp. CPCC 101409 TaxID=3058041 RepID=UPI0026728C46|nr:glycoside hydrolase domain-containing protein [Saccharibacillus sp. CPCC 101409]MDO3411002.1 DUF1906 domain-containing protein [Saccharibacillus sp. CPCC 101409]
MDARVLQTQKWLNSTYKTSVGYKHVDEDGLTGWNTIYSLTRALQLELGISGTETSDSFGPKTESLFKPLRKQDAGAAKNNQYFILQGALFCKGYNPGGLTGNFFDGTEKAVKELQSDIGLTVQDGVVTAALMKALMNMNSYKLSFKGRAEIRQAQQNLNQDYNKYFGLMPTDGVYSRDTNKALIYALQAEEGLPVGTANGSFGPSTIARCPTLSENNAPRKLVQILQYALSCNGSEYDTGEFNGVYGARVKSKVSYFQSFMMLPVTGIADLTTIKQLLTSNGDTSRSAKACDASTILTEARAKTLVANGYEVIGRYLTGNVSDGKGGVRSKAMTPDELKIIFNAGLRVFPIYQDGGYRSSYFVPGQGTIDGYKAHRAARQLGFPSGTSIYFAVDYDAYDYEVTEKLIPYFREIREAFDTLDNSKTLPSYKISIYGARNTCIRTAADYKAQTEFSFVSDMSTGFSGNLGFPMPDNWAFDQFFETSIGTGDGLIGIDKDAYSGRDPGVSALVQASDPDKDALYAAWVEMVSSFPLLKDIRSLYTGNLILNTKQRIYESAIVDVDLETRTTYTAEGNEMHKINITNGKPGVSAETMLGDTKIKLSVDQVKDFKNFLNNVSLTVENGSLALAVTPMGDKLTVKIKVSKTAVPLTDGTKATLEIYVIYTFKKLPDEDNPNYDSLNPDLAIALGATVAGLALVFLVAPYITVGGAIYAGAAAIIAFLSGLLPFGDDGEADA